jgi:hypothetical protein
MIQNSQWIAVAIVRSQLAKFNIFVMVIVVHGLLIVITICLGFEMAIAKKQQTARI